MLLYVKLVFVILAITISTGCSANEDNLTVRILFAGDLMLDRGVKRSVYKNFGGRYEMLFVELTNYFYSFDTLVVNLEGPISARGNQIPKKYSFRFETNVVEALKFANIRVVNLANNHIYDWGYEAFLDTLSILSSNNIGFFGLSDLSNTSVLYIFVKTNEYSIVKVGFLGFSEFFPGLEASKKRPVSIAIAKDKYIRKVVPSAKSNVDFLVVSFHWGEEYKKTNNRFQEVLGKLCIDLGADIVIGHHPHVIQNYEVYRDKYIFYSLGNFVFDQRFSEETMKVGLVELEIIKSGTNILAKVGITNFYQDIKTLQLRSER
ncbi:MAG: CapA family protein [Spirochaetia bacterium]|nr:CapA family protein [Spirochaetota bacterium]MCX8096705.1 CapA family protein [Spirochaetota bacterium]MDW8113143.1 CapA family protein [Spirochaetia bacterium]